MIGKDLIKILEKTKNEFFLFSRSNEKKQDVSDFEEVKKTINEVNPDYVIHLAALTDVDNCEKYPQIAYSINSFGTKNLALLTGKKNIPILYVSTGAVFDGKKPIPYTEYDQPNPSNIYGNSKFFGEKFVEKFNPNHFIVRIGFVFGGGPSDHKFVSKMIELMKKNTEINVVDDKFGSPTYTVDFCKGILNLIKKEEFGTYHMANEGYCSRFELANEIKKLMEFEELKINPVNSSFFPLPAPRPRMEAIENLNLHIKGWNWMRNWQDSLADYIDLNFK